MQTALSWVHKLCTSRKKIKSKPNPWFALWIELKLTPRELLAKVVTAKVKQHPENTAEREHMNAVGTDTYKTWEGRFAVFNADPQNTLKSPLEAFIPKV